MKIQGFIELCSSMAICAANYGCSPQAAGFGRTGFNIVNLQQISCVSPFHP